jgi:hypothetical protein
MEWNGINRYPPNFLFFDLDLGHRTLEELIKTLKRTLENIRQKFNNYGIAPTVLWSGNGIHIYLPVRGVILEQESIFSKFEQPSRKFIQWAEKILTNNKADPCHYLGLSFKNCMLRVPGSVNSKNAEVVRIIQRWNAVRPSIKPLLCDLYIYLADAKIKEMHGIKPKSTNSWKVFQYWRHEGK